MLNFSSLLIVLALQAATIPPENTPPVEQDIVIVGATKEYRLTAKQLRAAVRAFDKSRPAFAPQSRLWFEVSVAKGGSLEGVELALVNGITRVPLTIGPDRRFIFPVLDGDDWRLVSTKPGVPLRIRPWVVSPGTTINDIRLGDLSVQCRVGWAIARQSTSFIVEGMFDVLGGCSSSRLGIYWDFARPIASATIEEGDKRAPIAILQGNKLRLPTYLKDYTSEARVRIAFQ